MLVSFSIDPDALDSTSPDLSAIVACHRRVIQEWRKHGMLIHSHETLKGSALINKLESLPQECRKLWQTAMTTSRRRASAVPWDGTFPNEKLSEMSPLAAEFILALLEPIRAEAVCGLGPHESSRFETSLNGMELCKFHSVSESSYIAKAQELAIRSLNKGENCGSEWNIRYTNHLKNANNVVVVDKYILTHHMRRYSNKEISGLTRLLNDCFNRPRDRAVNVKIICAVQNRDTKLSSDEQRGIDAFEKNLATRYSGGGIRKLECYVVKNVDFSENAHARFFRTDYLVFGIDRGLDSFGGYTAERDSVVWRNDMLACSHFSQEEVKLQSVAIFHLNVI